MTNYLFEKEIRVFGMKRSGNSAMRNFIVSSLPRGVVIVLYNTNLSFRFKHAGPFPRKGKRWYRNRFKYIVNSTEHMPIPDIGVCLKPRYCYHQTSIGWARHWGKKEFAKDAYNLVMIRSPHNHLASVLKFPKNRMKYLYYGTVDKQGDYFLEFMELWIQYAEEVLGITNYIPEKIVVSFDKLVLDSYYRKSISDALGIPYVDSAIDNVPPNSAIGSSFDQDEYVGRATEMKVLDRWKYLIDPGGKVWWKLDECKEKLFQPKVVEYTKELFGIDLKEIL